MRYVLALMFDNVAGISLEEATLLTDNWKQYL